MEISINNPSESIAHVRLSGKFTIEDISQFKEKTGPLAAKPVTTILMSFTDLDYVDSSGIGSLILLMNTAKNQGVNMVFYNVQPEIKNVFRISHLDKFFNITTAEELVKHYPGIRL
jgi:anti-sigma B factor antagonist